MILVKKFKFFLIILFIFSYAEKSFSIEPNIFVQSTVNRASDVLGKNYSKTEKIDKLKFIAKDTVDILGIGYYSLGQHKKNLSDDKKKEYFKIFEEYFLKSFASRLAEYSNPKIDVISQKKLNEKYTMVHSVLIPIEDREEIIIDWRVNTKDLKNPLIIDIVIEGVSLAKVQKEEFNSIILINDGDINALFKSLKDFINK
tara:strand:+ start:616 stop:1215 length:600 start_codon:yes stop_codon:yes gene_type:complete